MLVARLAKRDGGFCSERKHDSGAGMTAVFGSPPITGLATRRSGVIRAPHDSWDRNTIKVDAYKNARSITISTNPAGVRVAGMHRAVLILRAVAVHPDRTDRRARAAAAGRQATRSAFLSVNSCRFDNYVDVRPKSPAPPAIRTRTHVIGRTVPANAPRSATMSAAVESAGPA